MKKFLVLLFVLAFNALACFADYKPIPADKSKQYKAEVESIINNEVPKAKKEVNQIYKEAKQAYSLPISSDTPDYEQIIDTPVFYVNLELIKLTCKYVNIEHDIPATDFSGTLYDFLYPYFQDNKVNTKLLDELDTFTVKRQEKIHKMQSEINN